VTLVENLKVIRAQDIAKRVAPYSTSTDLLRVEWLPAADLLRPQRFDLLAKYLYAKHQSPGEVCNWQRRLYLDHIQVFNGFVESDGSDKFGKAGFMAAYDSILTSIAQHGFDSDAGLLPISRDGVLLDGAHRATASLYQGCKVACARFDEAAPSYDYRWFRERGLPEHWLDAMASELCRLKPNTFIVLVYPRAQGRDAELQALVETHGSLWYAKQVKLHGPGPVNLVRQVYADEPWVGSWRNGFAGAGNKAGWGFHGDAPLRVFVVESDPDHMLALKQAVRELYQVENHSIHINDTHAETLQLAGLLLNTNSIHFMNRCNLVERSWFWRLFRHYQKWQQQAGVEPENYCIDGSAVMAAYGLRESRDIDFLHLDAHADTGFREIGSHNHEARHYQQTIENLIIDPRQHFYYAGSKFLALPVLRAMKQRRGESKDMEDVRLIDELNFGGRRNWQAELGVVMRNLSSPRYLYRQARFLAFKVRYWLAVMKTAISSRSNHEKPNQ